MDKENKIIPSVKLCSWQFLNLMLFFTCELQIYFVMCVKEGANVENDFDFLTPLKDRVFEPRRFIPRKIQRLIDQVKHIRDKTSHMQMDALICNKCFTPTYRGKRPYNITQCGHISCQACLQQVEKQCPQCQRVDTMSLPLKKPLIPKLIPYFQPLAETLETLLKVDTFRSTQLKITMQRFHELDKKYEILKTRYWLERRNLKALTEKYISLKNETEKLDKKLLLSEMQRGTPRSVYRVMETPTDSGISVPQSSSRYTFESSEFLKSVNTTPMRSVDLKKQYRTTDGFRIPMNRKPPRSMSSLNMLS